MATKKRSKSESARTAPNPDERLVTERQALYLSELSGVKSKELVGKSVAQISDSLKWHVDPKLLMFRRICGRVVKRDSDTGELLPVPNATVYVEDTDCTFLGFFPIESPWAWFFPLVCRREDVARVRTDACGRFCVFVPRWEIDRILRFRRERICLPKLFRPSIRDVLEDIQIREDIPLLRIPGPRPDPAPFSLAGPGVEDRIRDILGADAADRLQLVADRLAFGESTKQIDALLDAPAISSRMMPPLPAGIGKRREDRNQETSAVLRAFVDPALIEGFDPNRFVGPFLRCHDVVYPVWETVLDVPDITFRVTQDVDGDGDEEIIYSEEFFEIRWNADAIPDAVLEVSEIARATPNCRAPEIDPGICTRPTIVTAGLMSLQAAYHDATTGYATRPNRPRPGGFRDSPRAAVGEAPYTRTLQLYGCHRFEAAEYYRLVYSHDGSPEVPFTRLSWYAPSRSGGGPVLFSPDADGWYEIQDPDNLVFPDWLFNWNTRRFRDGHYTVRLQLGNASKSVIEQSDPVAFMVDNSRPSPRFTGLRWRLAGGAWRSISLVCPVIRRAPGVDIEVEIRWEVSANHLRDVDVIGRGCGGTGEHPERVGDMSIASDRASFEHWHVDPTDNSYGRTAVFSVPGSRAEGSYIFWVRGRGRAFNPAGSDGGPETDWNYDVVYRWRYPRLAVAIINA